jgi:predicted dinucleotide-utilizing enzyme
MTQTIRVALVGLGEAGEVFAGHLQKARERGVPVEVVAVTHSAADTPLAIEFSRKGVPVFTDARELTALGRDVDIIFDLSGERAMRQQLRLALLQHQNMHTVIVSETIARLLWFSFGETREPPLDASAGY